MPTRKIIIENGRFYHILNRSIQNIPIFSEPRQCRVFLDLLKFYNQLNPPGKYSVNKNMETKKSIKKNEQIVNIINYCLMPNHFHLTLLQKKDRGITTLIQRVSNSFSHFYNIKFRNVGPLFQGSFKSIGIENIEQLLHLSRYIHLNPVTANIVEKPEDYVFSSYKNYIGLERSDLIDPKPILSEFKSIEKYKKFVSLQKDYQRNLSKIKEILLEQP
jgi:putative transposase